MKGYKLCKNRSFISNIAAINENKYTGHSSFTVCATNYALSAQAFAQIVYSARNAPSAQQTPEYEVSTQGYRVDQNPLAGSTP